MMTSTGPTPVSRFRQIDNDCDGVVDEDLVFTDFVPVATVTASR